MYPKGYQHWADLTGVQVTTLILTYPFTQTKTYSTARLLQSVVSKLTKLFYGINFSWYTKNRVPFFHEILYYFMIIADSNILYYPHATLLPRIK